MSGRLHFAEINNEGRRSWEVSNVGSDSIIGLIEFWSAWNDYVFSPSASPLHVYDVSCLREIADFAEAETGKWRAAAGAGRR